MTDYRKQSCRHFNGIQRETCEAGIRYDDMRQDDKPFSERWPCVHTGGRVMCWEDFTE